MGKAQEDKFFKTEQERDIQSYVERLKREGRLEAVRAAPSRSFAEAGSNALPQVLAMSTRIAAPAQETINTRTLNRDFMTKHIIKGSCTGNPMFIGSVTLGSRVSLGKGKWEAGTASVEGATIFSVHKAAELMQHAPEHLNGVESRAAKYMVDNSVMEIAGTKLKLMPDPTPGRALAWGGTLAVWGTAIIAVGTARALGITSLEDVQSVMSNLIKPWAGMMKSSAEPLKVSIAATNANGNVDLRNTRFAKDIKAKFTQR